LAAVLTSSLIELIAVRALAGVALGGMLPIVVTLNNEFAPARVRATLVVLIFTGVTFGGGLPGFVAAKLMGEYGWRSLFWIGGIAPIVIASILAITLPESIKFLALRPRRRNELVALLKGLRSDLVIDPDTEFVISGEENRSRFSMPALLEGRLAVLTPLFWISNFVAVMSLYFMNQWMPTVLWASGIPVAQAAIATTLFQFGGTLAGLISMRFLDKYGFIPVPILFACSIPIAACIGIPNLSPYFLLALLFGAGFCILGLQFGNIATEANIYPTYIRAWGVGSNFAIGRIGGALGPLLGGFAFGAKLPAQQIFLIATLPLIVGLIATLAIMPLYQRHIRILRADPRWKRRCAKPRPTRLPASRVRNSPPTDLDLYRYATFSDLDSFADRMIANMRFNGYSKEAVLAPAVRRRFAETFAAHGGRFDQPVRIDCFGPTD
jgi:AAHS family 4-hydroxybenzoate transporter-like MFS transporter